MSKVICSPGSYVQEKGAASEAMGKIELTMSGLKKTKKNNEKYVAEYKNMKEIRDEAKNNCRRIPIK